MRYCCVTWSNNHRKGNGMRSMSRVAVLGVAVVMLGGSPQALATTGGSCTKVEGTIDAIAVPQVENGQLVGFHDIITDVTGPLGGGGATADLVIERRLPGGTLMLSGTHVLTGTRLGVSIITSDRAVVTPSGVVHDRLTIVSGASGILRTHGTVDFTTGALSLRYSGRVCRT